MNLRVAMIAPPWLPIPPVGYGGIENVLFSLVPELIKLGVDVELFTVGESKLKTSKKHWLYPTGQYQHIHKPQYDSLPISIAHMLFALNRIVADGRFDIIHDHNGFIGPLALSRSNKNLPPSIHTIHGPPFSTPDRLELGLPDNLPMWRQLGSAKNFYLVGVSKAIMKSAPRELKPVILPSIHNAIRYQLYPFEANKSNYFITLARFHPEKGQALAVQACLELGYRLKMAGAVGNISDPKQVLLELANPLSSYRSLIDFRYFSDSIFPYLLSGKIENVGEVKGQRKLKLISRAKALLFPILWEEPFGLAAIEALACGTPVIAMARGALPEIIEHGVNGFLVNNERELRKFMKRVDEIDPVACRKSVERNFSAPKMAKKYLAHYQTILKRH